MGTEPQVREPLRLAWQGGAMLYAPDRVREPTAAILDPGAYGDAATAVGEGGRAAAWFVHGAAGAAVLRRYRRGGLMARLGRRGYLWLGEPRTRSFAEFRLLYGMWRDGLPVPRPLAAGYWRRGMFYGAAILVERIAGARALAQAMDEGPACEAAAGAIGLETLLPVALRLANAGSVSLARVLDALTTRPAGLLGLPCGRLAKGAAADLVVVDTDSAWIYAREAIRSRSKNTPFEGGRMEGRVLRTLVSGVDAHVAD